VSGPLDSRPSSAALPPVLQLRPYQQRWIDDDARFKGAVKAARIGFSFATAAEAVLDCLAHKASWSVLSASKAQSNEFIEEGVAKIIQAMGAVAEIYQEPFADELGSTDVLVQRVRFPNGSRIVALPANPRTARGYPGNAILDEYAHHEDSFSIWAAIGRQVALGHKLRVLSTPNGEQGKFFDLAREFGLADGIAPTPNPVHVKAWSWHWVDVNVAILEGCPIDPAAMRELFKDDEIFAQEFLCAFLKAVGAWLPLDLIAHAEDSGATMDFPAGYVPSGRLSLGIDVARDGDRTIAWLDEEIGDVAWTRMVLRMHNVPFFSADGERRRNDQARILLQWVELANRTAMDSTGIGLGLFEFLAAKCPGRVMGVNFAGSVPAGENVPSAMMSSSGSVKIKTDLAVRMKQRFEQGRNRIPHDPEIRQELQSVKREYSGGAIKFEAPRIEIDTAVAGGKKRKVYAHADAFWAKALADLAAAGAPEAFYAHADAPDWRAVREPHGPFSRLAAELAGRELMEGARNNVWNGPRERSSLWR
jgi:phage FluMu gp28-like protein